MRSRNFVTGVVSSVVVVLVALGLLVLLGPSDGDDIELPDRIGDLVANDTEAAYPGGPPNDQVVDRARTANGVNSDGWSDVFDGAAADTRVYVDPETGLSGAVTATVVRADAGPLLPQDGFVDPEQLGFALPPVERITDGDVECLLLRNLPPRAGTDPQPDQAEPDAVFCQRRSGSLTVRVRSAQGDTDAVVDLVDDLWDELD